MTVRLPGIDPDGDRLPAGAAFGAPPESRTDISAAAFDFGDFGESLIAPLPEIRRAGDVALYDDTLATATRAVGRLATDLISGGDDVARWPNRFAGGTRRLRDTYAQRLPDGPERDRFDASFDLFAKATAVETRGIATRRRIADNRDLLMRALDGYADLSARALSPATVAFADAQGEAAIRRQQDAQVLTEEEADTLAAGWRLDLAARRARQFVRDDPAAARDALEDTNDPQTALLDDERRAALRAEADRRDRTSRDTAALERDRVSIQERLGGLRARRAFEQTFFAALADGTAAPDLIDNALFGRVIDTETADRLRDRLQADHDARMNSMRTAEAVDARLVQGGTLDPADPGDMASAETWFGLMFDDALAGVASATGPEGAALAGSIRDAGGRLGFLPPGVTRKLDLFWNSGEPTLMGIAAEAGAPPRPAPTTSAAPGSDVAGETDPGGDLAIQPPPTDRDIFRELFAAGLDPAAAKDRVREMFLDPGTTSGEVLTAKAQQKVRDRLKDPDARTALRASSARRFAGRSGSDTNAAGYIPRA